MPFHPHPELVTVAVGGWRSRWPVLGVLVASVGVAVEAEDDEAVQQSVEHGGGNGGVAEDFAPDATLRLVVSTMLKRLRIDTRTLRLETRTSGPRAPPSPGRTILCGTSYLGRCWTW